MFIYNKDNLKELLEVKMEKFWKIPHENKDLSSKIRNIYRGINLLQIAVLVDATPIMEIYALGPYFNPDRPFIFASNIFINSTIMDVTMLFCQYYLIAIMAFIVLGYDFLYLALCTELTVQVKLLKYKLKEVFTKTSRDAVYGVWICVRQHNFLLT